MNHPADRKPRSQNARVQKKYCFRCSETHSLIGNIWPNLVAQIWPNLRFVWVFGKMCMSLFHPLLEQAFQRRDSFFLEATVSIDIQEKIFAFWTQRIGDEVLNSRPCSINGSSMATDLLISPVDCLLKLTAVVCNIFMQRIGFSGHFWVTFGTISQQQGLLVVCSGFQMFKWATFFDPRITCRRWFTFLLSSRYSYVPDQQRPSSLQSATKQWQRSQRSQQRSNASCTKYKVR